MDVVEDILVVAEMLTLVVVVGTHDRPCSAFLNGCFESRQIDFVQGPVVYHSVVVVAPRLLIVQCEVLYTGGNAVFLYFLNIRHDHLGCQVRVFSHIFEITAVERCTVDVHSRAEKYVLFAVAGFFAYSLAIDGRHFFVPSGCKTGECGESHAGVTGPACLVPLVPKHLGTYAVRAVCCPEFRNTETLNAR